MAETSRPHVEIPLFPLPAVLFPEADLALRIVEQRYITMVSECTRANTGFGVCLMLADRQDGVPSSPAAVGTLAQVIDFDRLPGGLLGIHVRGCQRFQVQSSRVRDDGLIRGQVDLWEDEPAHRLPPEFGVLATVLERLIDQLGGPWKNVGQHRFDDAGWVGMRLAELLPLPLHERQYLLELTDPEARLAEVRDLLPRFQPG